MNELMTELVTFSMTENVSETVLHDMTEAIATIMKDTMHNKTNTTICEFIIKSLKEIISNESVNELLLIKYLLIIINNDKTICIIDNKYDDSHPLVKTIVYLANVNLTGDDGYYSIYELKKMNVHIYPLEQDRFGWLIGAIELDDGIIVFG